MQQVTYVAEGYMEDETKCGPPQDALLNTVRLALNADTKIREANTRDGFPLVYVNLVSIWSESLCANYIELRVSQLLQIKLPQQNKAREHEVVLWNTGALTGAPPTRSSAEITAALEGLAKQLATAWQKANP